MLKRMFQGFLLSIFRLLLHGYFSEIEEATWISGYHEGLRVGRSIRENSDKVLVVGRTPTPVVKKQIEEILKKADL